MQESNNFKKDNFKNKSKGMRMIKSLMISRLKFKIVKTDKQVIGEKITKNPKRDIGKYIRRSNIIDSN